MLKEWLTRLRFLISPKPNREIDDELGGWSRSQRNVRIGCPIFAALFAAKVGIRAVARTVFSRTSRNSQQMLSHLFHRWRRPRSIKRSLLRPVNAHVKSKALFGRWKPIRLLLTPGSSGCNIDGQRAVRRSDQGLVLRGDRIPLQLIRREEMVLVVQSQRPETLSWRFLTRCKGDSVGVVSVQLLSIAVEVLVEVLRLPRQC